MFLPGIRGVAQTIYFPLITVGSQDFGTGFTDGGSDCDIIKDGGASSVATNDFAEEGNGWYSLVITSAEKSADVILLSVIDSATKAFEDQGIYIDTVFGAALGSYQGVERYVVNDTNFTPTSSVFEADRGLGRSEEATTDHFKNRRILFVTGSAQGESSPVTAYIQANGRGKFTVTNMVTTPVNGDIFVIL